MTKNIDQILNFLDKTYPDAKCALEYTKDYELLIAVMLSAQTTDIAVNKATKVLFSRFPSLNSLKNAELEDIEECIKFLGLYKNKAKNVKGIAERLLLDCNGIVPNDANYLVTLPGVGNKTRNCVLAELFNEPYLAVDTHVYRVAHRLGLVSKRDNTPYKVELTLTKYIPEEDIPDAHHWLLLHGRYVCTSRKPHCEKCELEPLCPKILEGSKLE